MLSQESDNNLIPVFILHWNCPDKCIITVKSFLEQDIPLEIAVIDNGSLEENAEKLRLNLPSVVKFFRLSENKGWGGAFNIFLKQWLVQHNSSYCVISAHDALLKTGCLKMLLKAIIADRKIGIISPEYGVRHLPKFSPVLGPRLINNINLRPIGTVESVDFVHGTVMMFRRNCLAEIGLFDERFFVYGDELEICIRAKKHGWKNAVVWGAIVSNPITVSPKTVIDYLFARNTLILAKQYGSSLQCICRLILIAVHSSLIWLKGSTEEKSIASAKFLGIKDFWLNHFGKSDTFERLIKEIS